MNSLPTLLIPDKPDPERQAVADAWRAAGGRVREVGRFWVQLDLEPGERACVYGHEMFGLVMAQVNGWQLATVDDAAITRIGKEWTKRKIELVAMGKLSKLRFPIFVKPVQPKQFHAGVYPIWMALLEEIEGIDEEEMAMVSEVVEISAEARAFVLDGKVMDIALYAGQADLMEAEAFVGEFLADQLAGNRQEAGGIHLPRAFVVDIAFSHGKGWMVLEFNSAWGAGLNGCEASKVLPCIVAATI